jgi:hypothetical protein
MLVMIIRKWRYFNCNITLPHHNYGGGFSVIETQVKILTAQDGRACPSVAERYYKSKIW